MSERFTDRLAALVEERRSQVCLGLDPVPSASAERQGAEAAADEAAVSGCGLIEAAGESCIAIKPQLARFERFGAPGWTALERVCRCARDHGLLVIADAKRGDVPHTAEAYADGLFADPAPEDGLPGLGADAVTVNPLMGIDSLEPFVDRAERRGGAVFALVRTSNPGAADLLDLTTDQGPVHEQIARQVDQLAGRLEGGCGLSGVGAVVGATAPGYIDRLRDLMPTAVMLLPGVGAQGGSPDALGAAFRPGRAGGIVPASRSIAASEDPAAAAEQLREALWEASAPAA